MSSPHAQEATLPRYVHPPVWSAVAPIRAASCTATGDAWRALLRTTARRMAVAFASSLAAGYLTPMAMLVEALPESLLLGGTFAVSGGAQQVLMFAIKRFSGTPAVPPTNNPGATP